MKRLILSLLLLTLLLTGCGGEKAPENTLIYGSGDYTRINPAMDEHGEINLLPVVYLSDYPVFREAVINFLGNTAMFIPLGIVWPFVFKKLDTHAKVIAAGVGFSLCIEILQIPFFDRVTDVDDLLLNSLGFLIGYGIYLLVNTVKKKHT